MIGSVRGALSRVPLRARLVAILLLALLAALTATGYGVQAVLQGYLVKQIDDQLTGYYHLSQTSRFLNGILDGRSPGPTTFAIDISIPGHPELSGPQSPRPDIEPPAFTPISVATAKRLNGTPFTIPGNGGDDWRGVAVAATLSSQQDPTVALPATVTLALPLQGVDQAVRQLRMLTLLIGGIVIAVCALLGWLAIRRSFQPLVEVEETAAAIAAGDLSRRIPQRPATTEVGRLTESLNGMLTQIETAFRARQASEARTRRFAADASHELRTPLAAIRGYAELYRQGAVPAPEVPRTMRRIEDEATRMGGLVEDLLMLARLDERRPAKAEPVDLAVLAGDAVHDVRGLDPARPVQLAGLDGAAGPVPAVVVGDEGGLRQVVTNLVGNAVRHTPQGTPVEVAVGLEGEDGHQAAVLEVRDHGPGLPPEEADKVFERFYRVDSSRRRGTGGGSGLGLSIVAAVTAAHGGTVAVRPTPGGGATFRVALPVHPNDSTDGTTNGTTNDMANAQAHD